jgi:hypothetical protein
MLNIFEQPWTLVGASVVVLLIILTIRSVLPEKRRWWQLLIPAAIAIGGFGLDFLVQTDLEKINSLLDTGTKAVEEEDCGSIAAIIADNYSDSFHITKSDLIAHCKKELSSTGIEKGKKRACLVELSPPTATATLFVTIRFSKDSYVTQNYKSTISVKAKLNLEKQLDKNWLITRTEILEIDRIEFNWRKVR